MCVCVCQRTTGTTYSSTICSTVGSSVTKPLLPLSLSGEDGDNTQQDRKQDLPKRQWKLLTQPPSFTLQGYVEIPALVSKHEARPAEISLIWCMVEFVITHKWKWVQCTSHPLHIFTLASSVASYSSLKKINRTFSYSCAR